jgi:hypothetical protein
MKLRWPKNVDPRLRRDIGAGPNGAYLRGFLDDFPRPAARRPRDRIE